MPVEFLTREQEEKYGNFIGDPSPEQLAKCFLLDDQDRILIFQLRSESNRSGFALQLGTVRFLGTFLVDPTNVPANVSQYVAKQLGGDVHALSHYCNERTIRNHAQKIKKIYGYHDFTEQPYYFRLVRWLYNHFWLSSERPSIIFDLAVARCREQKILLPGITVLERLISQVRERATSRLWAKLASLPDANQGETLEKLLLADSKNKTGLERLRQPETQESAKAFLKAIKRFNTIATLGASQWNIAKIPLGKIRVLSRYASVARAQTIERMPDERRLATLAAFAIIHTISSQDDVIDYMERYFSKLINSANNNGKKERLRSLKDLDGSARDLSRACALLLDESIPDETIRKTIFESIPKERLQSAMGQVDTLTRPADQTVEYTELFRSYSTVRQFLPELLKSIEFQASPAGQSTLAAWRFLARAELKTGKNKFANAPTEGMSASWKRVAFKENRIRPCPYTFWAMEKMLEAIKSHDIYVEKSDRYSDPRSKLLQGEAWESVRSKVISTLGWSANAQESLHPLKNQLDSAFKKTAKNWDTNPLIRIEVVKGKEQICISPLDKLEEPDSLVLLRKRVSALMPNIDLPELLLEIAMLTGFVEQFTHISQGSSRMKDLHISICAVLIAKACNIGFGPLVHPGIEALEYDRLTWVEQNYFRTETLLQAINVLVEYLSNLPLTRAWGNGYVASADGLRHGVSQKTIHAGPNPQYFGITGRGITSYELISDFFGGLHRLILTGTMRDSMYLIELVLDQKTTVQPHEIMTDTAGYSDIVFGLFALLGYQFSPRIADMGSSKLWRFDMNADYSALNKFSQNKLREELVERHWDDMLRIAGSLKLSTVNPTSLIQMLQRNGKPTLLGRAIGEFGRIHKTLHHLAVMDDKDYRRRILTQLNRGEAEHDLKRDICYWKRGELQQAHRAGQEDQLHALALVTNAVIIWNTRYMQVALDVLQKAGYDVNPNDKKRLYPLGHGYINIVGKYSFNIPEEVLKGHLRPLQSMDNKLFW